MTVKNIDGQIDLFTEAPYVPEWLRRSKTEFDPALAAKWKREKMAIASASPARQKLLDLLRPALRELALSRADRCVSADDAQRWLLANGYKSSDLGNGMGSIFRGSDFELVSYRPSERASRHKAVIGLWRLRADV